MLWAQPTGHVRDHVPLDSFPIDVRVAALLYRRWLALPNSRNYIAYPEWWRGKLGNGKGQTSNSGQKMCSPLQPYEISERAIGSR